MAVAVGASRVALFGNVANSHYRAALALRANGVDAHLFVSTRDAPTSRPETIDAHLLVEHPAWIHEGDWITPQSLLVPWRSEIVRRLADFDVVIASGPGPIYAQYAGRPWAFYVTGGDLTVKPFPFTFWTWYPSWPHRGAELLAGAWQRRAIRRADQIWFQPFAPMTEALDRLRVPNEIRSERYVPMTLDARRYDPEQDLDPLAAAYVDRALPPGRFVVFHPSRLVITPSKQLVRSGQWKGNGTLIEGFAQFVRSSHRQGAILALIDAPSSRDVQAVRELISRLGIEDQVKWLKPPNGKAFDHDHMLALYRRADVAVGEFGIGWFGYVALEGAAMATPVINRIDESAMARLYPWHPFISCGDGGEVAGELERLADDLDLRIELGERGRRWILCHHGTDSAGRALRDGVASLVDHRRPSRAR